MERSYLESQKSSVLEPKVFNLFVNDLEKVLCSEAADCAAWIFITVKIKAAKELLKYTIFVR